MRNNIDKETYEWLFKIILFFSVSLSIITMLLMIDLNGFAPKTVKISSSLLGLTLGVGLWIKHEYSKLYPTKTANSKKTPMWISTCVSFLFGFTK